MCRTCSSRTLRRKAPEEWVWAFFFVGKLFRPIRGRLKFERIGATAPNFSFGCPRYERMIVMKKMDAGVWLILILFGMTPASWAVGASGLTTQLVGANALGQGNAFAAEADDPSAIYYNPAGLTQLSGTQLTVGTELLLPM